MVFNRELKDYYCEKCKKSLKELEEPKADLKRPEEPAQPAPVRPPEVGTVKGILFIMIGSVIQLIAPWVCQTLSIISIFLFIFGFYMVYQDRRSQSKDHMSNVKLAAILVVIWIALNIITIAYSFYISNEISSEIADLDDKDVIQNSLIVRFLRDSRLLTIIAPLSIGILALFRYLSIKSLIQQKLKNILTIVVIVLLITGLFSMYLSMDYTEQIITGLEDPAYQENTTKEDFATGTFNYNESSLDPNFTMIYAVLFLGITAEAIMILCFYWTYTYQRNKKLMFKDML
jgi:hypothetical protein